MNIETRTEGLMSEVQDLAKRAELIKTAFWDGNTRSEVLANLSLAIRHLEDAQSRFERAWIMMGNNQTN